MDTIILVLSPRFDQKLIRKFWANVQNQMQNTHEHNFVYNSTFFLQNLRSIAFLAHTDLIVA